MSVAAGAALIALLATAANAQSNGTNSSSFNAGYGRSSTASSSGDPNWYARDMNGNRVIVDGVIMTGEDQSSFSSSDMSGASGHFSGAGSAMAIGNNLSVITQGNWNTVIVDSTQINNGDVTAGTTVNGVSQDNGG
jgi:holdfast attachment protein HfaA